MNRKMSCLVAAALAAGISVPVIADDQPVTVSIKRLGLETALKIAQGAVAACRKDGVSVGVTVVDRGGHPQVVLRDTLAPDVTLKISYQKAYTAMSFNAPLSSLENRFTSPFSPGKAEGLMFYPGGLPIAAGGVMYGGIGVSGAPSGHHDERCAQAGLDAVMVDLEMEGM